ncbi:hypothetical protein N9023_04325 [Opitutaceae bacterium]|nr:hypothetical protein [Opitutaceae bacterium]
MRTVLWATALLLNLFVRANDAGLEGEVGGLYERALTAQEELRTDDALALLLQVEKIAPTNAKVLQKIARQYSDSTIDTQDEARQNLLLDRALDYSQRTTEIDPTDPVNVLSLAVVKGKIATLQGNKAKVEAARNIKADARRAIELDPDYAWAHHVLGRWHREVDELGSIARFFTKLLYGGLPEASIEEAVFHLEKATELEPENLNHFLELGFAYRAAGESGKARSNFERGLSMPIKEKHDEAAKFRARRALEQLG